MATDSKRPGSRLTIIVIVLLAVSAAVIAMWRVSTTSTVQEAPYFPPGHIQIASNQKPESPSEESNAPASQAGESTTGAGQAPESVNPSGPSAAISQPASAVASAAPAAQVAQVAPASPASLASPNPQTAEKQAFGSEPSLSDVRESIEQWRQSWESRQAATYIEFYHPRFPNLTAFARQKNSVMSRAEVIEVKVSEIKLSLEPGLTKAEFRQHYKSNTYESFDIKTQHWVMTNSGPRIIEETIKTLSR
ncbi:MAG: hypothetical protein NWS36_01625 [Burkholderiaceae bacterium]|nr:hypothetical protein [Burkholderiaceae bacterium]